MDEEIEFKRKQLKDYLENRALEASCNAWAPCRFDAFTYDSFWMYDYYREKLIEIGGLTWPLMETVAHELTIKEYLRRLDKTTTSREERDTYKEDREARLIEDLEREGYEDAHYDYRDPYERSGL